MTSQLSNIIQQYLTAYAKVRTRTDGGYAGDAPPISPEEFKSRLEDEAGLRRLNAWPHDDEEDIAAINAATVLYKFAYGAWAAAPLAGDAPQSVRDWQAQVRTTNS